MASVHDEALVGASLGGYDRRFGAFLDRPDPSPLLNRRMLLFARHTWPDTLDVGLIALFLTVCLLLPLAGHYFMVVDFRAYLRALRGVLVRLTVYLPELPAWTRYETPPFLRSLGLRSPCTENDVKRAYRRLAEKLHPDRGGDIDQFLLLQQQCEQSLDYVRRFEPAFRAEDNA